MTPRTLSLGHRVEIYEWTNSNEREHHFTLSNGTVMSKPPKIPLKHIQVNFRTKVPIAVFL